MLRQLKKDTLEHVQFVKHERGSYYIRRYASAWKVRKSTWQAKGD